MSIRFLANGLHYHRSESLGVGAEGRGAVRLRMQKRLGRLLVVSLWFISMACTAGAKGVAVGLESGRPLSHCSVAPGWGPGGVGFARGINLAGGEFNPDKLPGRYGQDYVYPSKTQLDYYSKQGFDVVRLPFLWERVQPKLYGDLSKEELQRILAVVTNAQERGMRVILDPHNYARYRVDGKAHVIGSALVPVSAFTDFWRRLAHAVAHVPGIYALGLMNEPYKTNGIWRFAAQKAVYAIRSEDRTHLILAPGDQWSGAWSWERYNRDFLLRDPADRLAYAAHQYFDLNRSGTYRTRDGPAPQTNDIDLVRPFASWLKTHHVRGVLTEIGVPSRQEAWFQGFDQLLDWLAVNQIPWIYWAGGNWPADYVLSSEPTGGVDAPIMRILTKCRRFCGSGCEDRRNGRT